MEHFKGRTEINSTLRSAQGTDRVSGCTTFPLQADGEIWNPKGKRITLMEETSSNPDEGLLAPGIHKSRKCSICPFGPIQ